LSAPTEAVREPKSDAGSLGRILAAFRLTSSATLLTLFLGVAATKLIAVIGGPSAIALMGLYRNLGALVSRSLILGLDTVIVQKISTATGKRQVTEVIGAAFLLLALQAAAILLLGLFGAGMVAGWLFGAAPTANQVLEVRVVLAMAFANLALQTMTAVLSGQVNLKQVALVGVASAVVTLGAIYPLLLLGNVGLAINVGSGSIAGAALAMFYVWKVYQPSFRDPALAERWRALREAMSRSAFLIIHPVVMMGSLLAVQSIVHRHFGMPALGAYNAATTILDTGLMVLMSSAKTYFLPSLGQLEEHDDKAAFLNRVLSLNLAITSVAAVALLFGAPLIVLVLFSARFGGTADLVATFSLALVGQAFIWSYSTFILHHANYRLFFLLDLVWAAILVGGTLACAWLRLPLGAVAWVYAASYLVSGLLYAGVTAATYGAGMLSRRNMALGALALLWVGAGYGVSRLGAWPLPLVFLAASLGGAYVLFQRFGRGLRRGGV